MLELDSAAEAVQRTPLKNLDPFGDHVRLEPAHPIGIADRGHQDKTVIFSSSI